MIEGGLFESVGRSQEFVGDGRWRWMAVFCCASDGNRIWFIGRLVCCFICYYDDVALLLCVSLVLCFVFVRYYG